MYSYSIHGIVEVVSELPLFELEYFQTEKVRHADISIRVDPKTSQVPLSRRVEIHDSTLSYAEHFGRLGAKLTIDFRNSIHVSVNELLGKSKTVVYVNVVEPLLRLVLASKGYVLLHAACLSDENGNALLISAPPDTGKTTLVLRCLPKGGFSFLSDDMTIIDQFGSAYCYPKPFTISYHTLKAVSPNSEAARELELLKFRSSVHSRRVRRFIRVLGLMNIPILSINAIGQMFAKAPKAHVTKLLENVKISSRARVRYLYLLERSGAGIVKVPPSEAFNQLMKNGDEAFLFPPYSRIFPYIKVKGQFSRDLLRQEESIIRETLSACECYMLKSPDRSWDKFLLERHKYLAETPKSSSQVPVHPLSRTEVREDALIRRNAA